MSVVERSGQPGTRETPRKLAPPRGVPGPAVSASRGRSRRYERPFDRSCLTIRPRPSGEVSFRPVPARRPLPMAPCEADAAPFGERPVERSRSPFGLRADPFGPGVPVPVSLPGDKSEGRRLRRVRPPETLLGFRERRRRFARAATQRAARPLPCLVSRVSCFRSRSCQREKPRGSSAFASPSRGSQPKQLAPFRHTSDSGLTLRLRCRLGSFALRFYPSPVVRCRSVRHPRVPCGHRPTLRQFGVTRRDLGGPDGHWHLSPKSATPIRGADRSRSTRRSVRSFAPEVSLRCDGGPESPSSGSLFRPKPSERVGTYGRSAHYVNRIGWSVFARLPDFSRPAGCTELHRCGSCHTGAV